MVNGKISNVACILANGLVAMLVIVSLLSIVVTAAPTLSNSGGGNWQYYKEIIVKENSGSGLTDYQVLVQLSSVNFPINARSDGADIRFTGVSGNELSYWIEGWDYAGKSAKIWVKVPSVSAGASVTIKMYYGNPSAGSSSNSDMTFDFFDDFSNDLSKWNNFGGTGVILDSGRLKIFPGNANNPYIKTLKIFNRGIIIEVDAETSVSSNGDLPNIVGYGLNYGNIGASSDTGAFVTAWYGNNKWGIWEHADASGSNLVPASFSTNHIYRFKLYVKQNEYYADIDDGKITITRPGIHTNKEVTLGIEAHGTIYATTYFDNVRVRKYASTEPNLNIGTEQPAVPPTTVPSTPTTTQTAEPESSAVLLHGEKTEVLLGEDVLLKLSAVNLIANPPMSVQVILYPPSGMSVTSSEFVKSGAGIYTTTYSLNPSEGKDIEIRIKTNQVGDFNVKGRIVYYFGDNKSSVEDHTLNLPIKVRKEGAPAQNEGTPAQKQIPGFEVIIGISGLLLSILLMRRINKLC